MKEAFLWGQLCLHQIESYFPCIRVRPVNPRAKKMRAYFPGYVFVNLEFEQINNHLFLRLPGLAGIVSFGGIPSPVPDNLIDAIRQQVDEINVAGGEGLNRLKPGDVVIIEEGPFNGYKAILDACLSGEARVRVLLNLLNGSQVRLELPGRQLQLIKQ
jgi:transcriptional antiterminator RfaH